MGGVVVLQGSAGRTSFYLTFITGPWAESGKRIAGVLSSSNVTRSSQFYGVGQENQPVFVAVVSSSTEVRIM